MAHASSLPSLSSYLHGAIEIGVECVRVCLCVCVCVCVCVFMCVFMEPQTDRQTCADVLTQTNLATNKQTNKQRLYDHDSRFDGKLCEQSLDVLVAKLNVLDRLLARDEHRLLHAQRSAHSKRIPDTTETHACS